MSKPHDSHVCTCPSGDGSLRWPCPMHPPAARCDYLDECGSDPAAHQDQMIRMVDAAMATANISPSLRRSDCQRVISAALAAIPHAPKAQPTDAFEPVRQVVRDYHYALDTRQHGGVAADAAIHSIERVLDMCWQQGREAGMRAEKQRGQDNG